MGRFVFSLLAVLLLLCVAGFAVDRLVGGQPEGKVLSAAEKSACGITAEVTEGPYYVSGTAALVNGNLNTTNLVGDPIRISGHVYEGMDNARPIANATIELWHADASGNYHPNNNGAITSYKPEDIALRGFIKTDEAGAYSFTTIYPGEYSGRTRHIHVKIKADGMPDLTTQLILAKTGDQISFDDDTVSQGLPTCHLLKFDSTTKPQSASFDFRLATREE
jgi:protocatechuate 3,4-dioxygenase beta subunit